VHVKTCELAISEQKKRAMPNTGDHVIGGYIKSNDSRCGNEVTNS
jgi:hypothetical protein